MPHETTNEERRRQEAGPYGGLLLGLWMETRRDGGPWVMPTWLPYARGEVLRVEERPDRREER